MAWPIVCIQVVYVAFATLSGEWDPLRFMAFIVKILGEVRLLVATCFLHYLVQLPGVDGACAIQAGESSRLRN
jgi:hypothetical protein